MLSRTPRVSTVVCAYTLDRWADLGAALASVQAQEPPAEEIILVIDHNPALLEKARAELTGVTVVASSGPQGLSGARNTGVAAASGDVVAFLDDDAVAQPGWLDQLCRPFVDSTVLGTGGRAIAAWDTRRPEWFPLEFDWVIGCSYRGQPEVEATVRNPIGCSMAFRRDVFERVGGFRPEIGRLGTHPVGCEETELSIRAVQAHPGSRIVYAPASMVRHRVPVARTRWRYFRSRCFAEGQSKALVAALTGSRTGLSAERTYTLRTLPRGVGAGLIGPLRGDFWGPARAAAIILGLATTTLGYVQGRLTIRANPSAGIDEGRVVPIPRPEQPG